MKKIYLMLAFISSTLLVRAQNATIADQTNVKRCYTTEILNEFRSNHPHVESDADFESWINRLIQQRRATSGNPSGRLNIVNYNLPIIFHVIASGETVGTGNNTSQALIIQQVLQLNKDFANQSNSPYSVSANTGIQFSLAQKDTSGNVLAEPGIDRINATTRGFTAPTSIYQTTYIDNTIKTSTYWDPTKYLNIWLVPNPYSGSNALLGYATFPSTSGLPGLNDTETAASAGVVIQSASAGSVFQPSTCANVYGRGRTLTHELGHFFGLRHIWGDANCGTDYVDDTPIHQTSNTGVPTHPKTNTCIPPTVDEMFENYMDYTDDVTLNTFTSIQVDRMQTVMANSPRRGSLNTSPAGYVPATATNRIAFNDCIGTTTVSEAGVFGTYPRYRDINLYINVENKAIGSATVSLITGGTAILNQDYIFTTPTTMNFVAGDNFKPVTVRILDDANVDGNKTLTIGYIISGTGVTAGTTAQTYTININDDDNFATTQTQVTILNETFETGAPTWSNINFVASPVNTFVVSSNGNAGGSGACAHITNDITSKPNTYTKTTAATVGFRTPLINASGLQDITVSFNYRVWGEVIANTAYDYGRLYFTTPANSTSYGAVTSTGSGPYSGLSDSVTSVANIVLPATFNSTQFYLAMLWFNNASGGNNPPINFDNFIVRGSGVTVETLVSNSYAFDIPLTNVNNFRSLNNRSILALSAPSVTTTNTIAAVAEAGTDRPTFSTNGVPFLRSRKVITLASTPDNTSGTYTVKLYYTAAELAAWGTGVSSLKVMKVNNGVSLSGDLNSNNAIIVTPTLFEDSIATRGYYAFTATFTTGYGQYVLVANNAVLPVKLLSFTGSLEKNKSKLNWKTANEINNKGFEVERSIDGIKYEKIDFVSASATNSYEVYDATIIKGNKYYYRLKQIDIDGNYTYSPVVIVNYFGENGIFVFPNPVKNNLIVQQGSLGRTSVVVTDLAGKTIYTTTFSAGTLSIDAQTWSNGVYMVRVIKNGETSNFKIMKQ